MAILLAAALSALEVGVGFDCGARTLSHITVLNDMAAIVEVPRGCPLAGSELFVRLQCEANECRGDVQVNHVIAERRADGGVTPAIVHEEDEVGSISGPPNALKVLFPAGPMQDLGAALRFTVLGNDKMEVPDAELRKRPVRVHFAVGHGGLTLRVRPGEHAYAKLNKESWGATVEKGRVRIDREGQTVVELDGKPGNPVTTKFGVTVSVEP